MKNDLVTVQAVNDTARHRFIAELYGNPHTTIHVNDKAVGVWYMTAEDKKTVEEMEKEMADNK